MIRGRLATRGMVLVLAAALVAGCGGSGSEPVGFLEAGDAICADAQGEAADLARRARDIQAQGGTLAESDQFDEASELWGDQIEFTERFRDDLADLEVPPGDEARVAELLASLDEGIVTARGIKARLDDDETVPPELLQTYGQIVERGNALARAYGFQVCGRSA